MRTYALHHHFERDLIVAALRDDDIRIALARLNELLVHRLHRCEILVHHAVKAAAAVTHIAHDAAQDAHVRVGVDENLDIHKIAQLTALENEDAFYYNDSRGADGYRPVGAVVNGVVVDGTLDAVSRAELLEILDEYIGVEGIRVVIVELCPLLVGGILWCAL